jgi:hypothetical protein
MNTYTLVGLFDGEFNDDWLQVLAWGLDLAIILHRKAADTHMIGDNIFNDNK